jgi:hypothetical protein
MVSLFGKPREKVIERKLGEAVEKMGGFSLKLGGVLGIPDRLVLLPRGRLGFVELKREGEALRSIQIHWVHKLRALGFVAEVVRTEDDIRGFLDALV